MLRRSSGIPWIASSSSSIAVATGDEAWRAAVSSFCVSKTLGLGFRRVDRQYFCATRTRKGHVAVFLAVSEKLNAVPQKQSYGSILPSARLIGRAVFRSSRIRISQWMVSKGSAIYLQSSSTSHAKMGKVQTARYCAHRGHVRDKRKV